MALIGDGTFPKFAGKERYNKMKTIATQVVLHSPSVIYLCPTKGVNINIVPFLIGHEMKFRLILPSRNFFSSLDAKEKKIFKAAAAKADKIIILDESECQPLRWFSDWEAASKKAVDNSDWVMLVHNSTQSSAGFGELLSSFKGETKPVVAVGLEPEE
jgi:hypothetical protein